MRVVWLAAGYLGLLAAKAGLALWAVRRERQVGVPCGVGPVDSERPWSFLGREEGSGVEVGAGVAVAQAILSGDPRLEEVLEANVLELPAAQFLWLIDEDDAEGQRVCRALAARHAARRIEILVLPPPGEGHNPKLHKLELARGAIREPVLLVLDDDTRMPAATLAALVRSLELAEVATSLPGYLDDGCWPSRLLAQFVDNNAALTYLPLLPVLPPLTLNGMAYALRREFLDRIGGFAPLLGYLTDDLAVAERTLAAGGRIAQSASPHWVETTVRDGRHYVQLMHRWFLFALLLLRKQPPRMRALIALLDGLPPVLLLGLVVAAALAPSPLALGALATTLALRALALVALQRTIYGRPLHAPFASLASELLQPLHLLHAVLWRRIVWRKRRYRVFDDRHFEALG